jgi:hypothetical protein
MVERETITVTGGENWLNHTGEGVSQSSDLTADEVADLIDSEELSSIEDQIVGVTTETLVELQSTLPDMSDTVLQYLGDISRRVQYRSDFVPVYTNELLDEWRDLRYAVTDEWEERYDRSRYVGPIYETDGFPPSIVEISERFLPDNYLEITPYRMGSTTAEETITGVVEGDTKESVTYRDEQGISRNMYSELMWTVDGTGDFEGEKFLFGPIGEDSVLLFHWNDYESEWGEPRTIGETTVYPTKYAK